MKTARARFATNEESSFWSSFTDVMSSMVFILFFFIIIMFIRQLVSSRAYDNKLLKASQELAAGQSRLEDLNRSLDMADKELISKKNEISQMEDSLLEREDRITSLEAQLEQDQSALRAKQSELSQVKSQLQEISVLRLSILNQVRSSIEEELEATLNTRGESLVSIDDNANLIINSSLLFAKGSSEITSNGHKLLKKFAIAFEKVLNDDSVRSSIDSIVISGHADSDDSYDNNYMLSCQRATSVITALMKENPVLENSYGGYFQASGFSEFRPVAAGSDEASKSKNRRIEISVNIKDSSLQKIISDYMKKQ